MKLLLTSAGVKSTSIQDTLVDLLGKSIRESSALVIPTAMWALGVPPMVWRLINGQLPTPMRSGMEVVGVLELTALPSIDREHWVPWV